MADFCESGNEPSDSLKPLKFGFRKGKDTGDAIGLLRTIGESIRRPEFECSGPQSEGPEFECSGPQLEGPEFEYSGLSLKAFYSLGFLNRRMQHARCDAQLAQNRTTREIASGFGFEMRDTLMELDLVILPARLLILPVESIWKGNIEEVSYAGIRVRRYGIVFIPHGESRPVLLEARTRESVRSDLQIFSVGIFAIQIDNTSCVETEIPRVVSPNLSTANFRKLLTQEYTHVKSSQNEEVYGLAENSSVHRIDIIAFKPDNTKSYIVDQTIRFESHRSQLNEVDEKNIYELTIPYYENALPS
ncbi:hypothetical protein ANN_23280 [Periplaneta americana]|uniref:Uncharacterized protein n=1 Tax=Periplaneta americana TaxID=6978 RepID=A0ABQ8SKR1_PERAM|nr:hypothetical protein ANN_23280 [Periplaneta americana]